MAAKIVEDLIQGHSIEEQDGRITRLVRRMYVDLDSQSGDASKRGYDLLNYVDVPDYRDAHPTIAGIIVKQRKLVEVLGADSAYIDIIYERATYGQTAAASTNIITVRGGSSARPVKTTRDANGSLVTVTKPNGSVVPAEFTRLKPEGTLVYTRVENTTAPGAIQRSYELRVNNATWNAGDAGTWLCMGVRFSQVNEGFDDFRMEYEFQYNPDGWNSDKVAWKYPDATPYTAGESTVAKYLTANFDALNLT